MDDKSKIAKTAESYIKYETGVDLDKEKKLELDEQGRIKVDKRRSTTINHVACANDLIKLAGIVPMAKKSRDIIQLKLVNPGIQMAGVCLFMRMRKEDVINYEQEGMNRIKDYLKNIDLKKNLSQAVEKFNKDSNTLTAADVLNLNLQGNKNSLITSRTLKGPHKERGSNG